MDISKIVLNILAGIGGVGVIFTSVIGFSSKFIAERLHKKYQLELNEKLEEYKARLDNKVYISKTKFDAEFSIYRNLSIKFTECVKTINSLFPNGLVHSPASEDEKKKVEKEIYDKALQACVAAQDELRGSTPFIPKELCDCYYDLLKLCSEQLFDFEERWDISFLNNKNNEELARIERDAYKRTPIINQNYNDINDRVREYLQSIDVLQ